MALVALELDLQDGQRHHTQRHDVVVVRLVCEDSQMRINRLFAYCMNSQFKNIPPAFDKYVHLVKNTAGLSTFSSQNGVVTACLILSGHLSAERQIAAIGMRGISTRRSMA